MCQGLTCARAWASVSGHAPWVTLEGGSVSVEPSLYKPGEAEAGVLEQEELGADLAGQEGWWNAASAER